MHGFLKALFDLGVDNFLTLLLDDKVGEVLGHLLVDGGSESDDRVTARVTNVNTDQHRLHRGHLVREFDVVEVSTHL